MLEQLRLAFCYTSYNKGVGLVMLNRHRCFDVHPAALHTTALAMVLRFTAQALYPYFKGVDQLGSLRRQLFEVRGQLFAGHITLGAQKRSGAILITLNQFI